MALEEVHFAGIYSDLSHSDLHSSALQVPTNKLQSKLQSDYDLSHVQ